MKLVIISDTHSLHGKIKEVPDGDVLIHCGDFTGRLSAQQEDMVSLNTWLGTLPHKHKLLVPGNHDKMCEKDPDSARALLSNGTLLIDEEITIDGVKFYGMPWTPVFGNWYFMKSRGAHMKKYVDKIPSDTDVLVTHGPPNGILDEVLHWNVILGEYAVEHTGCEELLKRVVEVAPKVHAFGHIHPGVGEIRLGATHFINAAICDDDYQPVHKPIVVEIPSK